MYRCTPQIYIKQKCACIFHYIGAQLIELFACQHNAISIHLNTANALSKDK